jgi:hypothetical protein
MKTEEIRRICWLLILLFFSLPATLLSQKPEYTVRRIDEPLQAGIDRGGLNDSSVVLGSGLRAPFLWRNGVVTLLPMESGSDGWSPHRQTSGTPDWNNGKRISSPDPRG